jgi:hypothetical protein
MDERRLKLSKKPSFAPFGRNRHGRPNCQVGRLSKTGVDWGPDLFFPRRLPDRNTKLREIEADNGGDTETESGPPSGQVFHFFGPIRREHDHEEEQGATLK